MDNIFTIMYLPDPIYSKMPQEAGWYWYKTDTDGNILSKYFGPFQSKAETKEAARAACKIS
jgi:hypothetical protein